jgi:anti-sigma factor RsiW
MCNFSAKLIAWMDGELPDDEAAQVERHVRACEQCHISLVRYKKVSSAFVAYCDAATKSQKRSRPSHWVPVLAGAGLAAAAALFLGFLHEPVKQSPLPPRAAVSPANVILETAPTHVRKVQRRHTAAKNQNANSGLAEPAIEINIPAEAMFPPGAVPEGVNFIADLSIAADGSVQRLRLRP